MSTGWWTTAFLWGLPITFALYFVYGGYLAYKKNQEGDPYDPNKYRS